VGAKPQVGQCGLRILRVTGTSGVPEYGRAPRHQSGEAGCRE